MFRFDSASDVNSHSQQFYSLLRVSTSNTVEIFTSNTVENDRLWKTACKFVRFVIFPTKDSGRKHNRSMMNVAAIIEEVLRREKEGDDRSGLSLT